MTREEILDRMIEEARGTGMSPLDKFMRDWTGPEGVAEREEQRAKVHAHFDAVRDKALAELWKGDEA